ncbi:MAG TPA: M36 family metallopeptidase, partial [Chthoniobacteraceae bacterium]|nr:M36 family metallopeptidase [Chthoniobacteraceae bacterium]
MAEIDKRAAKPGVAPKLPGTMQTAAVALRARAPGANVDWHAVTGAPRLIQSPNGFLTGPKGEGGAVTAATAKTVAADDSLRAVKTFLTEHQALFGHGPKALETATKHRDYTDAHNGLRTVVWRQETDGIPVFEGLLKAHLTARGELVSIGSSWIRNPDAAATAGTPARAALVAAPRIDAAEALARAGAGAGSAVDKRQVAPLGDAEGAIRRQAFTAPTLSDASAELTWLPMDAATMRLCWQTVFTSNERAEMFMALVDVETGEVLLRRGLTEYVSDASYNVFTSDSPTPFSPGYATPAGTQPALVGRTLVTTKALDLNASPNGWIDDGILETRGNNVDAHTDTNADNVADLPRPQAANRVFDFPLDLTLAPASNKNAAVTSLFYWVNFAHDRFYQLGFTEAAGNFQNNNFGRGGLGNDAVQADAQDGSGTNNANFSSPPDGSAGRVQMYVFTGPTPDRDGDFDAEVMLHECTHGLSNRLVGGGVGISALQTRGMGEGWSDFYAMSLLSEAGDNVDGNFASGGYASNQIITGFLDNYYYGIRRYPYSTQLTKNPLTFKDIDPVQASLHTGILRSPAVGTQADEVHNMGEVWCATLWQARANLVRKLGFPTGNDLMLQLVTDGMKLAPANPNFVEARNAILQAELVLTGGANRGELWTAFAQRGLGSAATSPSSALTGGLVESYLVPEELTVTPATGATLT